MINAKGQISPHGFGFGSAVQRQLLEEEGVHFNANGEVISIHRAGLPQAPGFALSVPMHHAVSLLPPDVKQRLGIP